MRKLRLKETCKIYGSVTRNRYGDVSLGSYITALCLYRNIENLNRDVNLREERQIQGTFWLDPTTPVNIGDVIGYNSQLYRIETLTVAKALLTSNTVHFYKCSVSLYRAIS